MEEKNEMTYEAVDETELEPVDYEMVEDESEESEELDLSKILKAGIIIAGIAGLAAFINKDKIREWKRKKDTKKLEKLAKKLGMNVTELENVIEAECKEVDSEDDDCESEEEEN